jgi:hypothetical protein
MFDNPFARIASAPTSPHLQQVRELRQTVESSLRSLGLVNVTIVNLKFYNRV